MKMSGRKTLNLACFSFHSIPRFRNHVFLTFPSPLIRSPGLGFHGPRPLSSSAAELSADSSDDTVEELLTGVDSIQRLMKMDRKPDPLPGGNRRRWFPYLDSFRSGSLVLRSGEVIEALDSYILEGRKERIRRAVENRSYSISLVVEGLTDFGNVSAAFRSADALGIQSVHVISSDSRKRCRL